MQKSISPHSSRTEENKDGDQDLALRSSPPTHILYACFHLLDERTDHKNYLAVLKVSSRWVVALSAAGADSSSTRSGARAEL